MGSERRYLVSLGFLFVPEVFHDFVYLVRKICNRGDAG